MNMLTECSLSVYKQQKVAMGFKYINRFLSFVTHSLKFESIFKLIPPPFFTFDHKDISSKLALTKKIMALP